MALRRCLTAVLVTLVAVATFGGTSAHAFTSEPIHVYCGTGNCWAFHEWAESSCSACTTIGTGWTSTVPEWKVPEDGYDQDVMDEGVWLINTTHANEATETGYVSGWWPYSTPRRWLPGLIPYGTKDGGGSVTDGQKGADSLVFGKSVAAWSYGTGDTSQVDENGALFWHYTQFPVIPLYRFNFAQGEVHATDCNSSGYNCSPWPWLNNCSPGTEFTLEYQTTGGTWMGWGTITVDYDTSGPYWANEVDADHYTNGGGSGFGCP